MHISVIVMMMVVIIIIIIIRYEINDSRMEPINQSIDVTIFRMTLLCA